MLTAKCFDCSIILGSRLVSARHTRMSRGSRERDEKLETVMP